MTAFVWGIAAGAMAGVVVVAVLLALVARFDGRSARTLRRQTAFRDWCERVGWCPAHNVADGSCPRVEVTCYHAGAPCSRFEECPGSAVLRDPATATATGTRLAADGIEWTYSLPGWAL